MALLSCWVLMNSCGSERNAQQFDFTQILGLWNSPDSISSQTEEWKQLNDSVFVGAGYVLEDDDTTFFERLEIIHEGGSWTYKAKVDQGQDSEKVSFRSKRQGSTFVEFVNEQYDFPKKIGYELLSDREMQAYIEGPRDGQNIRIIFNFIRSGD